MEFIAWIITIIGFILIFLLALFVPSYAIKIGINLAFGYDLNLFGIFLLVFAVVMIKTLFFSENKED